MKETGKEQRWNSSVVEMKTKNELIGERQGKFKQVNVRTGKVVFESFWKRRHKDKVNVMKPKYWIRQGGGGESETQNKPERRKQERDTEPDCTRPLIGTCEQSMKISGG